MSYDLVLWEGERPVEDKTAVRLFIDLYDRYMDTDLVRPPTECIAAYVAELPARWCDVTVDEEGTSPWSTGRLISEARRPLIYFPMSWSMAGEASAFAASLAQSMGLVCFDPQQTDSGPDRPCQAAIPDQGPDNAHSVRPQRYRRHRPLRQGLHGERRAACPRCRRRRSLSSRRRAPPPVGCVPRFAAQMSSL